VIYTHAHNWPLFKAVPVLRILIPFLIGIILNIIGLGSSNFIVLVGITTVLCFVFYQRLFKSINKQIVFYFVLLLLGYLHTNTHRENLYLNHYSKFSNEHSRIIITSIPEVKPKSIKVFADVVQRGDVNSCGKILLYFKKDSASLKLKYGDEILSLIHI
jgi:hypothetical protein